MRGALRETSAGIVAASLTIPLCVGAGVLAYTPLGPDWVARGAIAGLACAVVGGITSALFRGSTFVTTFPTTPICVIQASVLASVVAAIPGDPSRALGVLSLCVVCVGLWQILFALSGLSRVMRFVPHPVMAGFVSGVAVLIAWHQVPALLGVRELPGEFVSAALPHPLVTIFGFALLGGMLLLGRFAPKAPNLLAGLLAGTAVFHLVRMFRPEAFLGATIGALPGGRITLWPLLTWSGLGAVAGNMDLVRIVLIGSLTLALVGTLDTFFALRTAQLLATLDTDPRRDVFGQGMGNLASALAGGLVVSTSLSVSMANHRAGGRTRISTIASGGALLVGGLVFPSLVTRLPLVVLGAILVATSLRLVDRWSFQVVRMAFTERDRSKRGRAMRDGSVILAVFLATILGHPVMGVGVGFGLSCLLFILDMSRPVVSRKRDGTALRSKRLRSFPERETLTDLGRSVAILEMHGALFFGNTHGFAADVEALGNEVTVVILDCRHLRDVDTSGITALVHVARKLEDRGQLLLVAGARSVWLDSHAAAPGHAALRLFPDLEKALECAEDRILESGEARFSERVRSGSWILATTASAVFEAAHQRGRLPLVLFPKESLICKAGDAGDRMWILRSGTVAVYAPGSPRSLLLTRLGPGSPIGEMGLMGRNARSADVVAEEDVEAFVLTEKEFTRILLEEAELGQTILLLVAKHLASRLRETTEDLRTGEVHV
jgi:MFS superfamily sulfate permease-like transporter